MDGYVRGLLAVLVAIVFLAVPLAGATPMPCNDQATVATHPDASSTKPSDVATAMDQHRAGDNHKGQQKSCCSNICTWCSLVLPAPDLVVQSRERAKRLFERPTEISGLATPPALGPPRRLA